VPCSLWPACAAKGLRSPAAREGREGGSAVIARKGYEGEIKPATLGSTTKAGLVLLVWCKDCRHTVRLDPAEQAERYGAELPLRPDWASRLACRCGSREVDLIVDWHRPDG
jgi:hypothetical protein